MGTQPTSAVDALFDFNTNRLKGFSMSKVGGGRNYGYGKALAWAGKNALKDRYGSGHYGTVAAHMERWHRFVKFLKTNCDTKDARDITKEHIECYGDNLKQQVNASAMKVAYAQNLLSSVNVVLSVLRGDNQLTVSPSRLVGERAVVREYSPRTVDQTQLLKALQVLERKNERHVLLLASLCREFGLRFKEASLLTVPRALKQSRTEGRINITTGTKGGRGKHADRWVPVTQQGLKLIKQIHRELGNQKNLIPKPLNYVQWRNLAYSQWRTATIETDIRGFHDLRAAYACERYQQITGSPAPVVNGSRVATKALDHKARSIIALELGHNRINVLVAYIGSSK